MSMFPRARSLFRQSLAHRAGVTVSGFDFAQRIAEVFGRLDRVPHRLSSRHDCYPSPFLRSGHPLVGPGFSSRRSVADAQDHAFFPFPANATKLCFGIIKNPKRGSRTCSKNNSFLQPFLPPVLLDAWQHRKNAVLPVPSSARRSRMQPTRTLSQARPLVGLQALQAVACRVFPLAPRATDHLTAALLRSPRIRIKAIPDSRSGVAFSHATPPRPGRTEGREPCSRKF